MGAGNCPLETLVVNEEFWPGKSVLITGHTGFKGSWLSLWLQLLGARVTGIALAPQSEPNLFEAASVGSAMRSHLVDIRSREELKRVIVDDGIDIVFHMAAQSLVLPSYEAPYETLSINIMGTAAVLDAIRQTTSVRACVAVTSDKCYRIDERLLSYRESDPLGGHDPYSASKACAEITTAAFAASFFQSDGTPCRIASARAGNVIGGGDWSAHRLVPDMVRAFSQQQDLVIRRPHAIRPWQHVLEPLYGYMILAQALYETGSAAVGAWNFGPAHDHEMPVRWVIEHFARYWGSHPNVRYEPSDAHETDVLALDSTKAHRELGWQPVLDMQTTLQWTADWYRNYYDSGDARGLCERHIVDYMKRQRQ